MPDGNRVAARSVRTTKLGTTRFGKPALALYFAALAPHATIRLPRYPAM
jgi:hypothetical protein